MVQPAPAVAPDAADVPRSPAARRMSATVLALCWFAILAEGYDVGVLGAVLPALAREPGWALTPIALGGTVATLGLEARWNFYAFAAVGLLAALATAAIPPKTRS